MGRPLFLSLVVVLAAGCQTEPPATDRPPKTEPSAAAPGALAQTAPPTPFDAEPIVFDTVEPPEQIVQIPPRPDRPAPRQPAPDPPLTRPPPPPPRDGPSGSCDVRASESFCFTYTGTGWTPSEAEANCAGAPGADFSPGTCPLTDRIATCVFRRPSAPDREIVYTYYAPYDVGLAELACPGTFTRLP